MSLTTFAQTEWFTATEFAIKVDNEWSDWIDCDISVKIDIGNDKVTIYSNEVQIYRIIDKVDPPRDKNGTQVAFSMIDQDGDRGMFRIRKQHDGAIQIYVDFIDISWVYNIE
jgi:hypothetical protein